jgi:hypothetical protein
MQLRALEKKANKVEKLKIKKDGSRMWTEVAEIGELIRSGEVIPCPDRNDHPDLWHSCVSAIT